MTTFVLEPDDYTAITFNVVTPGGGYEAGDGLRNYNVSLPSLQMNYEQRLQFEYETFRLGGGQVSDETLSLVPIEFAVQIIGKGTTFALALANLLQVSEVLMRAVTNSNGYLKYKPDGLGAGIMNTYYRYVQSAIPSPTLGEAEYWGSSRVALDTIATLDGVPTRNAVVTLMTYPFGMSDPANPTQVVTGTTIKNIGDGTQDYLTVAYANVKGGVAAQTRILVSPDTPDAAIDALWIAKRTEGLTSFVSTYNAASAVGVIGAWSTEADASRCGGSYYRVFPSVNNAVYATRFTIANWASHRGRAAILAVVRNNGDLVADFDIYFRWSIAHYPFSSEEIQTNFVGQWEPILLGEVDLPATEMSSAEALDLYIDLCVIRRSGNGTFDVDCIKLLYTDESALEVDMPAGYGAETTHSFLLENVDEEIAHVVNRLTTKLQYIADPYGDFPTLEPDINTRLDFAWRRRAIAGLDIDMGDYDNYWYGLEDFDSGAVIESYPYNMFVAVEWRSESGSDGYAYGYPVDITNNSFDTDALVTAGEMREDGNDLRVIVDGKEVMRWLEGMDTSTTQVWTNLVFVGAPTLTILNAILSTGDVASITFNEATNALPATGIARIVQIGSELFTYASKDDVTKTIYGVKRAALGSSASAHNASDPASWIQHDIRIIYGNAYADAPAIIPVEYYVPDDFRPAFALSSSNVAWTYANFKMGHQSSGAWVKSGSSAPFFMYTQDHGGGDSGLSTWEEIGLRIASGYWQGAAGRVELYNPCFIANANFTNGEKLRTVAGLTWIGKIQSSVDGYAVSPIAWVEEFPIPTTSTQAWEAWSRDEPITASSRRICLYLQLNYTADGFVYLEASDCVVTLNSSYTPLCTLLTRSELDYETYAVEAEVCGAAVATSSDTAQLLIDPPASWPFAAGFFCFYMHQSTGAGVSAQSIRIRLNGSASDYYELTINKAQGASADVDYYEYHAIGDFAITGSPDLDDLESIELLFTSTGGTTTFYIDDVRIVAEDPDSALVFNDTADAFDFPSGTWHIYEQASVVKTLGQIDSEADVEKIAVIAQDFGGDYLFSSRCRAKRDDGKVGLVFRINESLAGSEDMYVCYLDTANQLLVFAKLVGGTLTTIQSASFTCLKDTDYYLGIFAKDTTVQCFASMAYSGLWDAENRIISTTDATYSTGRCGLITIGTLGRFSDIDLEQSADRHVPADEVTVDIYAWFRTVFPFYESAT